MRQIGNAVPPTCCVNRQGFDGDNRLNYRPTCLSTFSGGGGLDIGFDQAMGYHWSY